jgi:hypothetical protein
VKSGISRCAVGYIASIFLCVPVLNESRDSNGLGAGRPVDKDSSLFRTVQTDSGAHPTSSVMGTERALSG